jgi:phospholipid/cholesterol/gamma-HCH transport system substrate-binding protein
MALFRKSARTRRGGMSPFRAGLLAIVLIVVASYFAYTQANPFENPFELNATFNTVNNLQPDAPVRIAGVEVGVVKSVEALPGGEDGATVTMEIEQFGLPIHEDAELEVRPRIFLEGNEFVDIQPGTPSAPILESGDMIPVNQTATPVQFGQVLSVLQSDTREDLRTLFKEYAFIGLKGGGARGFHDSIKYWEPAYRNSALAQEATLGQQPGDLFRVLRGQQQTFAALAAEPQALQDLVTNFNITAAAFAREDDALQAAIPELRDVLTVGVPALQSLNSSFPGIQRFAEDALPAARSSRTTIPKTFPFIRQLRLLFRPSELQGLVKDLRPTIPALARLNRETIPFLNENRSLSRCTNRVLLPFARTPIPTGDPHPTAPNRETDPDFPDPDSTMQPFQEQGARAFVGLSGESRPFDANGKFFRANVRAGDPLSTLAPSGTPIFDDDRFEPLIEAVGTAEDADARPAPTVNENVPRSDEPEYRRTVFRPDFPCELSVKPDLRAPESFALEGDSTAAAGASSTAEPESLAQSLDELPPARQRAVEKLLDELKSGELDEKDLEGFSEVGP